MEQTRDTPATLPLMIRARVRETPELVAQYAKDPAGWFTTRTFRQLYDEGRWAAAGLLELGVKRGALVGLISDNRQEWLAADFGVLALGAADVPRGCDSTEQELGYIFALTECAVSFVENQKQVEKCLKIIREGITPALKTLVSFDAVDPGVLAEGWDLGLRIYSYRELIERGKKRREARPDEIDAAIDRGAGDDLATVIFTSGTTGEPKGVMLTHRMFLCQLPPFRAVFETRPGEIWLSVLPVWHVFERAVEYIALYSGDALAYSKPVAPVLMADFQAIRPHWMVAVPRIWEAVMDGIYRNVRKKSKIERVAFRFFVSFGLLYAWFRDLTFGLLPNFHGRLRPLDAVTGFVPWLLLTPVRGLAWLAVFRRLRIALGGRFRAGLSGGGTLPARVDHFFNAVGLRLQEGYGLTETSPIVSARRGRRGRRGTIGPLLVDDAAFRVLGPAGQVLPPGHSGILHVRGQQVTRGYYKRPALTAAALSPDGWLNTGDIAMATRDGELRITGRAKDTIVLRDGENVEPVPIEAKLRESPRIAQCVVLGQDQKYLAALIVPDQEAIMAFAEENRIPIVDYELLLQQPEVKELIAHDISDLVSARAGFKTFERVYKFALLARPFKPGEELSPKQEPLRHKIAAAYARQIQGMFRRD